MDNTIQAKRRERGISQKEFAEALDVDRVTVWRWEQNVTIIPYETLIRIAHFFQVAPVELIPDLSAVPTGTAASVSLEASQHG